MNRILRIVIGIALIFAASVAVLLYVMPAPHKPTDYLVIGGVGTMLCLLWLFRVLIKPARTPDRKPDS